MNFRGKKMRYIIQGLLSLTIVAIGVQGCISYEDDPACKKYNYMSFDELRNSVQIEEPKEIKKVGKIYTYNDILLVNEPNIGIHIIDNSDKHNPIPKAFISINGNIDIAVKDGFLYADSFMDLVVFDIRDIDNIKEITRKNNVFAYDEYQAIDENDRYRCQFDTTKGVVGVKR